MAANQTTFATILLALLGIVACNNSLREGEFIGEVSFLNNSSTSIWVERVQGFPRTPPCGSLVPRKMATALMGPMHLPNTVRIVWEFREPGASTVQHVSVVRLRTLQRAQHVGPVTFTFTPDHTWTVE